MEFIINTFFTVLIASVWLKVILTSCYRYTVLQKQDGWIEKKAIIKDCRIIGSDSKNSSFVNNGSKASFFAVFEHSGKHYGVSNISVSGKKSTFEKSIVSNLKIGDEVSVYCNKNRPMENSLCFKDDQMAIDIPGLIALFTLITIQFLLTIAARLY